MNPEELRRFAAEQVAPRLPWLTRHDLPWADPSDAGFVCPTEFVLTPVGPIKCDFSLTAVPVDRGRGSVVNVGFGFTPLYLPFPFSFDSALRRHWWEWSPRWPVRSGSGDQIAMELARAVAAQWPRRVQEMGTVSGLARSLRYDAEGDRDLEILAYSQALAGDFPGALRSLRATSTLELAEADGARIARMQELIQSDHEAVVSQLGAWRLGRLSELRLLDLAAPWPATAP